MLMISVCYKYQLNLKTCVQPVVDRLFYSLNHGGFYLPSSWDLCTTACDTLATVDMFQTEKTLIDE